MTPSWWRRAPVWLLFGPSCSLIRFWTAGPRVTLLFGTRYEQGLLYRAEFEALAESWPGFTYIPTLTRPSNGWQGRQGRVQAHLEEALANRTGLDVYICGLKEMVEEVRTLLKARGFDRKQIIAERYD